MRELHRRVMQKSLPPSLAHLVVSLLSLSLLDGREPTTEPSATEERGQTPPLPPPHLAALTKDFGFLT